MPIVSSDKFNYFRPERAVVDVRGQDPGAQTPRDLVTVPDSGASEAFQGVSRMVSDFAAHLRNTQLDDDIQTHTLKAMQDLQDREMQLMQDPDYRGMPEKFVVYAREIAAAHEQEIGDPAARRGFRQKFALLAQNRIEAAKWQSYNREVENQQAGVVRGFHEALDLIGGSRSMQEVEAHRQDYLESIDRKAAAGILRADWAEQQKARFSSAASGILVEQDLFVSPETAERKLLSKDPGEFYPGLSEEKRLDYLKLARAEVERKEAEKVRVAEKQEIETAKAAKEAMETTYSDALISYSQGKLTETMVQHMLARREIDPDKASSLINRLREEAKGGEKAENNPMLVGQLVARLEMGEDITADLDSAMKRGDIRPDTFISLKKQAAGDLFKRGSAFVSKALRPGEMDRFDQERNLRYARAMENYTRKVSEGQDPMEAARDVVFETVSEKTSAFMALPSPRYLDGDRNNLGNLNKAWRLTTDKWKAGALSDGEYQREIRLIERLQRLKRDMETADSDSEQAMEKRLNRAKR